MLRNITVITPSAIPYSILPPFVRGSVCGSLARKINPNSTDPLIKRNTTASVAGCTLLVRYDSKPITAIPPTVADSETLLLQIRQIPLTISTSICVVPIGPANLPMSISSSVSDGIAPFFIKLLSMPLTSTPASPKISG